MHGIIFAELKKYIGEQLDGNAWDEILREVGIGVKHYLPIQEYPDGEMMKIVEAVSSWKSKDPSVLLEGFGEFIVPALLNMYKNLIRPEWKTLELIENTEETIHKVVRLQNPGASPPALQCKRIAEDEVEIFYNSERKICSVAKGIVKGIAKHFDEEVLLDEKGCMNSGDAVCSISVKLV